MLEPYFPISFWLAVLWLGEPSFGTSPQNPDTPSLSAFIAPYRRFTKPAPRAAEANSNVTVTGVADAFYRLADSQEC